MCEMNLIGEQIENKRSLNVIVNFVSLIFFDFWIFHNRIYFDWSYNKWQRDSQLFSFECD